MAFGEGCCGRLVDGLSADQLEMRQSFGGERSVGAFLEGALRVCRAKSERCSGWSSR